MSQGATRDPTGVNQPLLYAHHIQWVSKLGRAQWGHCSMVGGVSAGNPNDRGLESSRGFLTQPSVPVVTRRPGLWGCGPSTDVAAAVAWLPHARPAQGSQRGFVAELAGLHLPVGGRSRGSHTVPPLLSSAVKAVTSPSDARPSVGGVSENVQLDLKPTKARRRRKPHR